MEIAKGIFIPIEVAYSERPYFYYIEDEKTGIHFKTEDKKYGRITFSSIDSVKICRGEYLPYKTDFKKGIFPWIFDIENSKWIKERYKYEKKHYGRSYEWGGNVEEMLSDYKHYLFQFHDEFIEVISKGFWFEISEKTFKNKPLQENHPYLPIKDGDVQNIFIDEKEYKIVRNKFDIKLLEENAMFYKQKIAEIHYDFGTKNTLYKTIFLKRRNNKIISVLSGSFSNEKILKDGIISYEEVYEIIIKTIS